MSTQTDDSQSQSRHTSSLNTETLKRGDRIHKKLVARNKAQLGSPIRRSRHTEPDNPDTQLLAVTAIRGLDDVHTAILLDPDTGILVRACRHDSNAAMTRREMDWKVKDIGDTVRITGGELEGATDAYGSIPDETEFMQEWAQIVLTDPEVADERRMTAAHTLYLRDPYENVTAYADIELDWED